MKKMKFTRASGEVAYGIELPKDNTWDVQLAPTGTSVLTIPAEAYQILVHPSLGGQCYARWNLQPSAATPAFRNVPQFLIDRMQLIKVPEGSEFLHVLAITDIILYVYIYRS